MMEADVSGESMIVQVDGRSWSVSGRVAKIVLWLLQKADRIERMERVRITFNCSGGTVSTELSEAERV